MANRERENNEKLHLWQERYNKALGAYQPMRDNFKTWQKQFEGNKDIPGGKPATTTYNFTKELIEAQIDSSIPMPSVRPRKPTKRNRELADAITAMLRSEMDRMPMEEKNDLDERITRVMSGQLYLVQWDNTKRTHNTVGELDVRFLSPLEIIPQEAVYETEQMDWFFIVMDDTKERIKAQYGVDVSGEALDASTSARAMTEELVTLVIAYYRNKSGTIGCYSWVGDTEVINEDNYFARKDKVCTQCGKVQAKGEKVCNCGNDQWKRQDRETETLTDDIARADGVIIPAMSPRRENGEYLYEDYEEPAADPETGLPLYQRLLQDGVPIGDVPVTVTQQRIAMEPTKIPYYTLQSFPIAVRKNVSAYQQFFGDSDCAIIRDQQLQANKATTKIDKKIATCAEFFTKPFDLEFQLSNDGIPVLNLDNPSQLNMLKAISLKFDALGEYQTVERAYYQAKSLLGVSDTYQGKADPTATSGKAKEIQVAQAAGIQKSKRVMKNAAYARLFENIFHFMLAFANEPRPYPTTDENGQTVESVFNRYDFLEQDQWGNWYYNDDFLFSVDESSVMLSDRQFLLADVRTDFGMGAFGNPQSPETMLLYWQEKEVLGYPNAKRMVKHWQDKVAQQTQVTEQTQAGEEVPTDEMPAM